MRMGGRELDAAQKHFSNSKYYVPVNHGAATKAAHDTCDGALHLDVVGASARSGVAACWISGQESTTDHTGLQYSFCSMESVYQKSIERSVQKVLPCSTWTTRTPTTLFPNDPTAKLWP